MTAHSVRRPGAVAARLLPVALVGVVSIAAAESVAKMDRRIPKPLAGVLVLACVAILLAIDTGQLFFGWLFLAPLFQESASGNRVGHFLSLAVYTAPPLVLLVKMLATEGRRPLREWFDWVPALYFAFVAVSLPLTASSEFHHGVLGPVRGLYQTVGIGIIVYYLAAFWRGRKLPHILVAKLLLLAAVLQAAMAVIEWPTHWNLWHDTGWQRAGDNRAIATLSNPAITGAFIGFDVLTSSGRTPCAGPAS